MTETLMRVLGWQGGTIHQLIQVLRCVYLLTRNANPVEEAELVESLKRAAR